MMVPQYSTKQFNYDPTTKVFSADASDLQRGDVTVDLFGRVFNDSADEGLILVSHVTGAPLVFYVEETHRNADGDVTHWELNMAPESKRQNPGIRVQIKIWND